MSTVSNIDMVEFGMILYFQVVFYHNSEYFELLISLGFLFVCFKKVQLENFPSALSQKKLFHVANIPYHTPRSHVVVFRISHPPQKPVFFPASML